jgi:hypothetical protein
VVLPKANGPLWPWQEKDVNQDSQLETLTTQLAQSEKKAKGFISPEMYGAVGDGVTDDTSCIRQAVTDAYTNNLTLIFGSPKYKVSGDNPLGLPKAIPSDSKLTIERSFNVDWNDTHFFYYPQNETDAFAFVGYLRSSEWGHAKITVTPPNGQTNYGDIFSTHFGITNAPHEFSSNILKNIWIDGSLRYVFNFDCGTDELQQHDDLTLFQKITAVGYKKFFYTNNSNAVANTFDNCATGMTVNGAVDFHIAGPWAGGLRVINHHFTIMDCDSATMFKCDAPSHDYATIYVDRPRVEVRDTATNWKYFDMTTGTLRLDDMTSVNYPVYSKNNIYGIARVGSRISFIDSSAVYTPINLIGVPAPGNDSAHEVLEFDHCSFVNGNTSNNRQSFPFINYVTPDNIILASRYHAIQSIYNFGNVLVKDCTGRWGDYVRWLDSYVLSNTEVAVVDTESKKKSFQFKNVNNGTVNRIATKSLITIPFDIVIENIEYFTDNFSGIDQVICVFPNGERTNINANVASNLTSLIDPNHPLCLSAGVKLQLHAFKAGVEVEEVASGVGSSYLRITYRLPIVLSELYNCFTNSLG